MFPLHTSSYYDRRGIESEFETVVEIRCSPQSEHSSANQVT